MSLYPHHWGPIEAGEGVQGKSVNEQFMSE